MNNDDMAEKIVNERKFDSPFQCRMMSLSRQFFNQAQTITFDIAYVTRRTMMLNAAMLFVRGSWKKGDKWQFLGQSINLPRN